MRSADSLDLISAIWSVDTSAQWRTSHVIFWLTNFSKKIRDWEHVFPLASYPMKALGAWLWRAIDNTYLHGLATNTSVYYEYGKTIIVNNGMQRLARASRTPFLALLAETRRRHTLRSKLEQRQSGTELLTQFIACMRRLYATVGRRVAGRHSTQCSRTPLRHIFRSHIYAKDTTTLVCFHKNQLP